MNTYSENLYDKVVRVTYEYLGPAADRFVTRQIRNHLHKEPEQLKKADLQRLIGWINIAMSLISNDDNLVARYIAELRELSLGKKRTRGVENNG